VAASCAVAAILGLDDEETVNAISLGASSAAGLRQNFGTDIKPLHAGNAARSGVVSAKLAALGFEGDPKILEGRWGFFNVFSPPSPSGGASWPHIELGERWHIVDPGVATKAFPSCGATHPGIGAMLELRQKGLLPENVKRIDVRVVDMTERILEHHRPQTGLEAKFSMEYCLARALVSGSVELDHFLDEAVVEEDIVRLIERTHMEVDPVMTEEWVWGTPRATEVSVELEDGETMWNRADLPPGSPGNFPRDLLETKFEDCFRRTPVVGVAQDIVERIDHLEECEDIRELTAMLVGRD